MQESLNEDILQRLKNLENKFESQQSEFKKVTEKKLIN